jgi:hypothetical protein
VVIEFRSQSLASLCPAELDPTPQTVAAEAWLSIAGGATGIGWFPHEWPPAVGAEIRSIDEQIEELKSALLAPTIPANGSAPLKAGARSLTERCT